MIEKILQGYLKYFPLRGGKGFVYNNLCKKIHAPKQVVTTKEGFRMELDPKDPTQRHIYWYGRYNENDEVQLVKKFLAREECFVDVGAHQGYFTLTAANKVGRQGKVFSFEPNPGTFELLRKNVGINNYPHIELCRKALADKSGNMVFHFKDDYADLGASLMKLPRHNSSVEVEVTTLDRFFAQKTISPSFIKIDAERCDDKVIMGAQKILSSKTPPALMTETLLQDSDAFQLLKDKGYTRFGLTKHKWEREVESFNSLWIRKDVLNESIKRISSIVS